MAKKARGLKVVAVDARDEGLALSRESGADVVLDARKGIPAMTEEAKKATGAGGVHASITVSDHPSAAETACAITRNHGRMVQVAVVSGTVDSCGLDFTDQSSFADRQSLSTIRRAHIQRHSCHRVVYGITRRG